jgi:hypothetical protein
MKWQKPFSLRCLIKQVCFSPNFSDW